MLTVKSTDDAVCPVELILELLRKKCTNKPIFWNGGFQPTQSWVLNWVRTRMSDLGKNPKWYTLRSFRKGASVEADEMEMPEGFLRASGGWKSDAINIYREERLPRLQNLFAKNLNKVHNID